IRAICSRCVVLPCGPFEVMVLPLRIHGDDICHYRYFPTDRAAGPGTGGPLFYQARRGGTCAARFHETQRHRFPVFDPDHVANLELVKVTRLFAHLHLDDPASVVLQGHGPGSWLNCYDRGRDSLSF
ncbi:hypothetical protein, partial [Paraburkholderia hospita]|uniref:hypothetical protein n=1 Tax=Paraburkholderia hospita TaxID=169430 RepID=UPI001A99316F